MNSRSRRGNRHPGVEPSVVNKDDDPEEVYSAGDSFFVPKGANTRWMIYDTVSKFWMITDR